MILQSLYFSIVAHIMTLRMFNRYKLILFISFFFSDPFLCNINTACNSYTESLPHHCEADIFILFRFYLHEIFYVTYFKIRKQVIDISQYTIKMSVLFEIHRHYGLRGEKPVFLY